MGSMGKAETQAGLGGLWDAWERGLCPQAVGEEGQEPLRS